MTTMTVMMITATAAIMAIGTTMTAMMITAIAAIMAVIAKATTAMIYQSENVF